MQRRDEGLLNFGQRRLLDHFSSGLHPRIASLHSFCCRLADVHGKEALMLLSPLPDDSVPKIWNAKSIAHSPL